MAYIFDLPVEILLKIFKFYLETENQKKLISCIGGVCKLWRQLSTESDLWHKCDGSLTNGQFSKLCESGKLKHTEELILGKMINVKNLPETFKYLSNLKSIDFSNVKHITPDCMSSLGEHCIYLREIKFSQNLNYPEYNVSVKFIYNFLELRGGNLTILDMSHTDISSLNKILLLVSKYCFNLQELLLHDIHVSGGCKFPLDVVQNGCPNIRILRVGSPVAFTNHQTSQLPGFPALEVFTHSSYSDWFFSDIELNNVLSKSSQLKVLDIRGCKKVSVDSVLSLPATSLEKLFISFTDLHSTERLSEIIGKWNESLSVLDISRMKSRHFDEVLRTIFSERGLSKLECLDLNYTNISSRTVIKIIENCESLNTLNLSSCRSVGRGFMRTHCGKAELKKLLHDLHDTTYVQII